jgi:hypothetical protein
MGSTHRRVAPFAVRRATALLLGPLGAALASCSHTTWVDVDRTGCSEASVQVMNSDPQVIQRMAAVCALNGAPAFAAGLRCHGHSLQVACRG